MQWIYFLFLCQHLKTHKPKSQKILRNIPICLAEENSCLSQQVCLLRVPSSRESVQPRGDVAGLFGLFRACEVQALGASGNLGPRRASLELNTISFKNIIQFENDRP